MSATTDSDDIVKLDNGPLSRLERIVGEAGARLMPRGVTPNQVTFLSGVLGVLSGVCFGLAGHGRAWFAVGAALVLLHWIGDNVDGCLARSRKLCSTAGRFLDIFADALTFTALGLGFASSGYAHFEIVATATLLCLLQYVLTVLWIALARIWPFPAFGPAEALLTAIVMALLMMVLPADLIHFAGRAYSLLDIGFALTIPGSVITLAVSGLQLFRHLQEADRAA